MIIVAAHITIKEGMQDALLKAMEPCVEATRNEEGNISYTVFAGTEDACKFIVFEEWETQKALDAHMETAHFKALGAALVPIAAAPLDIAVYEGKKL